MVRQAMPIAATEEIWMSAPHELIVGNVGSSGWKILKETGESGP